MYRKEAVKLLGTDKNISFDQNFNLIKDSKNNNQEF